jgi:hypothetical protein
LALYMVINEHLPEECEPMEADFTDLPERLVGQDFYCTCPAGEHAFYMFVEGSSAEDVLGLFRGITRKKSRAVPVDIFPLGPA